MTNLKQYSGNMTANDYLKLGGGAILATAVVFFGYKAYKAVVKKATENKAVKEYGKEVNKSDLKHSEAEFVDMASRIDQALNQPWNDNEDTVYEVLSQLRNKSEWFKLIDVFGLRKMDRADFFSSDMTLPQWFEEGMSSGERAKIKQILSNISVNY